MKIYKNIALLFVLGILPFMAFSQQDLVQNTIDVDYYSPKEYEISNITIQGADNLDHPTLILVSGLAVGDKVVIPSEKITSAIDKLWKQGVFENVEIRVDKVEGKSISLIYVLAVKPRLSSFRFEGIKRSEADKVRDEIKIMTGDIVTENMKVNCSNTIRDYFYDKGFYNTEIAVRQEKDTTTTRNDVNLIFNIKKGKKIKIKDIIITGNDKVTANKIMRQMKDTKRYRWWRIWKSSRYNESNYKTDKEAVITKYNDLGFRDAKIVSDSVYTIKDHSGKQWVMINMNVHEGDKFYFRDITWVGNTKYTSEALAKHLRIKKGDVYNKELLDKNINYDPTGSDISSLYQDDGYLFFRVIPVELNIQNDSIDIEMRVYEGKQARIGKVSVSGNTRTNDHVIIRELKTYPGELYSRDDVFRSLRELQQLQYFDQEKLMQDIQQGIQPDAENGIVNIDYHVNEVSSDKFEVSGGWGGGMVLGTIGVTFGNFSTRKFFNRDAWKHSLLPSGDGQQLTVRGQTNGSYYYSFGFSFTEPWLGGRKPNALSFSAYYSYQDDGYWNSGDPNYWLKIFSASVSLGKRLTWPDDYFTFVQGIAFEQYNVYNYTTFVFSNGTANNINYNFTLARNSVDSPIYPKSGSEVSVATQLTFPYSLFNGKDYTSSSMTDAQRYKWLEYYKVNLKAAWYFNAIDNLVVSTRARFGFLGQYNTKVGLSPFERYYVGGDGLSGYALDGREVVALRGYTTSALSPSTGAAVFDKFTMDVRYPITLNPTATVYGLTFFEAGNSWANFDGFTPFKMYRSAGVGIRLYMPMFGLIGLDWGYGFDKINGVVGGSQFHFSFNQSID